MAENLQIPCCCLVPSDAAGLIIGRGGATVRQICETSGAQVNVSAERDTPKALSDRIVTIQGTPEQKRAALEEVIRIVHRSQELEGTEEGIFVTVIPSGAVEHVVGPGGEHIRELVESVGAEVNISRHSISGTELQPVSVAGTPEQMLNATLRVLQLVQELADNGGLTIDSYAWPRRASGPPSAISRSSTPVRAGSDGTPRSHRTDAPVSSVLFVVSSSVAAWIVGRSGRTVNELRSKSGANLEVARTGGPLRIVEVRGSRSERRKAVELLLSTMEELPAGAPRQTQLLAPVSAVVDLSHVAGEVEVEHLGPEGADGFGTGSGCRLITCSGPQMHATAIDVAALLSDAAAGRSASPKPRRGAEEAPRGRAKSLGARSGHFGGPSSDAETQLLKALLSGPMPQAARLELLMPADFVRLCLENGRHLEAVTLRTGSHVELSPPGPEPIRMVSVSGTLLGNSVAVLQLQELLQQYQGF